VLPSAGDGVDRAPPVRLVCVVAAVCALCAYSVGKLGECNLSRYCDVLMPEQRSESL